MSYTFICTPEKYWYLKINTIEQLMEYWNTVFNPKLKEALDTIVQTKEFGKGQNHCNVLQILIELTARKEQITFEEAYEKIVYEYRIGQYQALYNGKTIYINRNMGWNTASKETEQFIHKHNFEFPVMKKDRLKIEQFPMGTHFYVFIDGVQLRKGENLKFDSYEEAYEYANQYLN